MVLNKLSILQHLRNLPNMIFLRLPSGLGIGLEYLRPRLECKILGKFRFRHYHNLADPTHTIYACSTTPGRSGVAVIRISGKEANRTVLSMTALKTLPCPRFLTLAKVCHPETGRLLDHAMIVRFEGPKSFTGEDVVEIHCHGGVSVTKSILLALNTLPSYRMAEPGEFTHRALNNGKMDLIAAEGLKDLINSDTDGQRQLALRSGELGDMYEKWRTQILSCMGHIEAYIEFAENEQLVDDLWTKTRNDIKGIAQSIQTYLMDPRRGEIIRSGVRTTLFGVPNAGKSSLLNHLAQQTLAIVSSIPGTTRDVIKTTLDVAGYPINICDTAGLSEFQQDPIEAIGVGLAKTQITTATDLCVWVVDLSGDLETQLSQVQPWINRTSVIVLNKSDLVSQENIHSVRDRVSVYSDHIAIVSLTHGSGLEALIRVFTKALEQLCGTLDEHHQGLPALSNTRHRGHLESCLYTLNQFIACDHDVVIGAEYLRSAASSIGRITGRVDVDSVLDVIFRDFCIGK